MGFKESLLNASQTLIAAKQRPLVIAIGGGSCSGKGKAARTFKRYFGESAVCLTLDDYYKEKHEIPGGNYDSKAALKLDDAAEHLQRLVSGKPIVKPVFDHKTNTSETTETVRPAEIIIIEGLFAFETVNIFSNAVRLFMDADVLTRLLRRIIRDSIERDDGFEHVVSRFFRDVQDAHIKQMAVAAKLSDVVIANHYRIGEQPELKLHRPNEEQVTTLKINIRVFSVKSSPLCLLVLNRPDGKHILLFGEKNSFGFRSLKYDTIEDSSLISRLTVERQLTEGGCQLVNSAADLSNYAGASSSRLLLEWDGNRLLL